jgi:hypothetical protein
MNVDFIGILRIIINKNHIIITFIDGLIKCIYWIAITDEGLSATKFVILFINFCIWLHSLSNSLISQKAPYFTFADYKYITS